MIAIIDYNAGNLKSVEKALHFLGEDCVITRNFHEIETADKVILPGVGAFGDAMEQLKKYELDKVIHQVTAENKPFLGICLGLQLLFEGSDESQGVEGLHVLDGQILRIPDQSGLKIPHIGWNYLKAADEQIVKATTQYSTTIHASVESGNTFACQFHPEKSGTVGLSILKNFAKLQGGNA